MPAAGRSLLLLLVALADVGTSAAAAAMGQPVQPRHQEIEIFVDAVPTGHNLEAALVRVAQHVTAAAGSPVAIAVHLRSGAHGVPRGGLRITVAHSPAAGGSVRWVGATNASVSSEQPVAGWRLASEPALRASGAYVAHVNASAVRHLWVDGRRASRTRRLAAAVLPGLALSNSSQGYTVALNRSLQWSNPSDVEFVYSGVAQSWSEARCTVASIETVPHSSHTPAGSGVVSAVKMKQPCFYNLVHRMYQPVGSLPPVYVDNVKEHLSAPGEFYFDSTRQSIYYIPLHHEDMGSVRAVIALEEELLRVENASRQTFEGITW